MHSLRQGYQHRSTAKISHSAARFYNVHLLSAFHRPGHRFWCSSCYTLRCSSRSYPQHAGHPEPSPCSGPASELQLNITSSRITPRTSCLDRKACRPQGRLSPQNAPRTAPALQDHLHCRMELHAAKLVAIVNRLPTRFYALTGPGLAMPHVVDMHRFSAA